MWCFPGCGCDAAHKLHTGSEIPCRRALMTHPCLRPLLIAIIVYVCFVFPTSCATNPCVECSRDCGTFTYYTFLQCNGSDLFFTADNRKYLIIDFQQQYLTMYPGEEKEVCGDFDASILTSIWELNMFNFSRNVFTLYNCTTPASNAHCIPCASQICGSGWPDVEMTMCCNYTLNLSLSDYRCSGYTSSDPFNNQDILLSWPSPTPETPNSRTALIVGLAVGVSGSSLLVSLCIFFFFRKRRKSVAPSSGNEALFKSSLDDGFPSTDAADLSPSCAHFSHETLVIATKGFSPSRKLGTGAFGTVYQGQLPDGRLIAVKQTHRGNNHGLQQFQNEVKVLSQVRHRNLVQLLGCCLSVQDPLLVYEFVANGTLGERLHSDKGNELAWDTRLTIAIETAEALSFLHNGVHPPILHRDVKSSNILLDERFQAKVADFGLSRLIQTEATHVSTAPQGTPGYLDPEYHETYHLSDKSDVYSFGVVLMELVTAKKAVDISRDRKEINLASLATTKIQSGSFEEIVDPRLQIGYDSKVRMMVMQVAEVAFRCLAPEKEDRPTMEEVSKELQRIKSSGLEHLQVTSTERSLSTGLYKLQSLSPTSVQDTWFSSASFSP